MVCGSPVVTNSCAFLVAHEAAGAAKHPAFPAPSVFEDVVLAKLGHVVSRECEIMSKHVMQASGKMKNALARRIRSS